MGKKILMLEMIIFIVLGILTGCQNKKHIWYNIAHENIDSASRKNHALFMLVNSLEELEVVSNERYTIEIDINGQDVPLDYYLKTMTKNYDEIFFSDKSLIVYLFSESNVGNSTVINSIEKNKEKLVVNTTHFISKESSATIIVYWSLIIEINKSDIFDISNVIICPKTRERR